jgi:hypothetical protein
MLHGVALQCGHTAAIFKDDVVKFYHLEIEILSFLKLKIMTFY